MVDKLYLNNPLHSSPLSTWEHLLPDYTHATSSLNINFILQPFHPFCSKLWLHESREDEHWQKTRSLTDWTNPRQAANGATLKQSSLRLLYVHGSHEKLPAFISWWKILLDTLDLHAWMRMHGGKMKMHLREPWSRSCICSCNWEMPNKTRILNGRRLSFITFFFLKGNCINEEESNTRA